MRNNRYIRKPETIRELLIIKSLDLSFIFRDNIGILRTVCASTAHGNDDSGETCKKIFEHYLLEKGVLEISVPSAQYNHIGITDKIKSLVHIAVIESFNV